MLLADDGLVRRRDAVEVIGAALAAKAEGQGHRRSASALGVPAPTVRGWLRRFARHGEAIRSFFTALAHRLDPLLGPIDPRSSPLADAVEAIAVAARAASLRLGLRPPWAFAAAASGGGLLANTTSPWAGAA